MTCKLRISTAAQEDLERLFEFLAADDLPSAIRAAAINGGKAHGNGTNKERLYRMLKEAAKAGRIFIQC
jgi:hypothetical protein